MVGVFPFVARAETTDRSDVDQLVRFSRPKSLLALLALARQIPEALGSNADLVTQAATSRYLRERILGDLQVIYQASRVGVSPTHFGRYSQD